jgi:hypothetical protein
MTRPITALTLALLLTTGLCLADKGQIIGTVTDARSGIPVSVHPVTVLQGKDTLARTLTDRLGKFQLDFTYQAAQPLAIKTGSTPGYLEAQGEVGPDTEVAIKVMPRWATILGIITDRATGRGLGDIKVQAGRGEKAITETWAAAKTDATGVYMMKVLAFEGDDVTKPVRDLWLSINEGNNASQAYAEVRTDSIPLWAWGDPTQPTKVEVSLPDAKAEGLTIEDVVSIKVPDALKPPPAAPAAPAGPAPEPGTKAVPVAPATELKPGEYIITCPCCGRKIKITVTEG